MFRLLQTDATFSKLMASLEGDGTPLSFPLLRTLKFRQTSLTDASINTLVRMCPACSSINLAFTGVRRPPYVNYLLDVPPLEKLSLTSTAISMDDLLLVVSHLPRLRSLSIDALGTGSPGKSSSMGNSTAMTLDDQGLQDLTYVLVELEYLESISLVGNTKLGMTRSRNEGALEDFIGRVGRKLKARHLVGLRRHHAYMVYSD